jgi:predicted permease
VGAALFLRTLNNLHSMNAGFHAEQVAMISLHLPDPTYREKSSRVVLWDRLLTDIRSAPGVQSASLSWGTPLDGRHREGALETPGFQARSMQEGTIRLDSVSEDYFATLGIALLQGRAFTERDRAGAPGVAMLNESAARHFFGVSNPVGSPVKVMGSQYQIVGVVTDVREGNLRREAGRIIYLPVRQTENARLTLCMRTAADPTALMAQIQRRLQNLGPDIHVVHTGTLAQQVDESLLQERLISTLATAFGVLALVLSAVGLYGVMAYSVARRIPEIGIRMALGAMPGQVIWSILRQTLWLVAVGLAAGVPVSIFLARLVENMFYGVTPGDLLTQAGAAGLLAIVALVASFLPARRAGRIDPLAALRYE